MIRILPPNIGIDLGTSRTRVYVSGKGIVLDEPTLVLAEKGKRRTAKKFGNDARAMLGRTTNKDIVVRPVVDGTVRDFEMTEEMLHFFIHKAIGASRLTRPRVVVATPGHATPVEMEAVKNAIRNAGGKRNQLHVVSKALAAALGCGLNVSEAAGNMIVDIGGGTTEISVISLNGEVISRTLRVGGLKMDDSIIDYVKRDFNMLIGDKTAEEVKIDLGSALPLSEERRVTVRGRDLVTSLPQTADLTSGAVHEALSVPCKTILDEICAVLERVPPELAGDILREGIYLTGGAAMLFGLDEYLAQELQIPIHLANDPAAATIRGLGRLADHYETLRQQGIENLSDHEEKDS